MMEREARQQTTKRVVALVRHGERIDDVQTDWITSAERPFDPPLTEEGALQAFRTGVALANERIDHVFCSPFLRCVQTAYHVLKGMESARDGHEGLLIKIDTGIAEYMATHTFSAPPAYFNAAQLKELLPEVPIDLDYHSKVKPAFPEAQSDMRLRCALAIETILARFPSGNLLLITHGSPVSAILLALAKVDFPPEKVTYSSITRVEDDEAGGWRATDIAMIP